jgi:hypothetical protein
MKEATIEVEEKLTRLNTIAGQIDHKNIVHDNQRSGGSKGSLQKFCCSMEEKEIGLSGSRRATCECWGHVG